MKPYPTSEDKKTQVERMFDAISPTYDRLNHVLSLSIDRLWRRRVVRRVTAESPARILDVATGTGDLAVAMARRMPAARIIGADISDGMLEIARRKVSGRYRIEFLKAEAERLPFADGSFDVVTVAFGVRNFQDIPASLAEFRRVLRRGGALFILEFSSRQDKIFGWLYRFYSHRILPAVGGLVSGSREAYEYLPLSVDEFPASDSFLALMREAGFGGCRSEKMTGGIARIYKGYGV